MVSPAYSGRVAIRIKYNQTFLVVVLMVVFSLHLFHKTGYFILENFKARKFGMGFFGG